MQRDLPSTNHDRDTRNLLWMSGTTPHVHSCVVYPVVLPASQILAPERRLTSQDALPQRRKWWVRWTP